MTPVAALSQGHQTSCCFSGLTRMLRMKEVVLSCLGSLGQWEEEPALVLPAGSWALARVPHGTRPSPALSLNALSLRGVIKAQFSPASACNGLLGVSQWQCREETPSPTAAVWLFLHVLSRTINTTDCSSERIGLWHKCSCPNKSFTCCGAGSPGTSSQGFCACLSRTGSHHGPSFFSLFLVQGDKLKDAHLSPVSSAELSKLVSGASCSARDKHWGETTLSPAPITESQCPFNCGVVRM